MQGYIDDGYGWFDRITIFTDNTAVTFTIPAFFIIILATAAATVMVSSAISVIVFTIRRKMQRFCTCSSGTQQVQFVMVCMLSIFSTRHCSLATSSESRRKLPSSNFLPENTHQLCVVLNSNPSCIFLVVFLQIKSTLMIGIPWPFVRQMSTSSTPKPSPPPLPPLRPSC